MSATTQMHDVALGSTVSRSWRRCNTSAFAPENTHDNLAPVNEAKAIKPNPDYPAGRTYHLMGFDTPTFTPIFVASRITGSTSHVVEQAASNSLMRPLSEYNGNEQRSL